MAKAKSTKAPATLTQAVDVPEAPRTVYFNFPPGKEPAGLTDLSLGDKVSVTVTGRVNRLSQERGYGSSLEVEISKVSL